MRGKLCKASARKALPGLAEQLGLALPSAVATGAVRIVALAAGTRGFADRAEFRLADSEVTLTGAPARILAPDGSETRGGRLTFRAAGDSLQVLGRGAERAYTNRPASE